MKLLFCTSRKELSITDSVSSGHQVLLGKDATEGRVASKCGGKQLLSRKLGRVWREKNMQGAQNFGGRLYSFLHPREEEKPQESYLLAYLEVKIAPNSLS